MKTTRYETENFTDIHSFDCSLTYLLHSHVQHSEAVAEQLVRLETLDARATSIVQNLDNKNSRLQAILLAPGIYASAEMPPPDRD